MCRRAVIELRAEATAAGVARRFVRGRCDDWGLGDIADTVALLVSELVTNAVLHACSPLTVAMALGHGAVEVGVADRDGRAPVPRSHRENLLGDVDALIAKFAGRAIADDERHPDWHVGASGAVTVGRGLLVLDAVADQWGVAGRADGKEVWFIVASPGTEGTVPSCPCPAHADYPLGSGRRIASG